MASIACLSNGLPVLDFIQERFELGFSAFVNLENWHTVLDPVGGDSGCKMRAVLLLHLRRKLDRQKESQCIFKIITLFSLLSSFKVRKGNSEIFDLKSFREKVGLSKNHADRLVNSWQTTLSSKVARFAFIQSRQLREISPFFEDPFIFISRGRKCLPCLPMLRLMFHIQKKHHIPIVLRLILGKTAINIFEKNEPSIVIQGVVESVDIGKMKAIDWEEMILASGAQHPAYVDPRVDLFKDELDRKRLTELSHAKGYSAQNPSCFVTQHIFAAMPANLPGSRVYI
jgi:hypothetical protein